MLEEIETHSNDNIITFVRTLFNNILRAWFSNLDWTSQSNWVNRELFIKSVFVCGNWLFDFEESNRTPWTMVRPKKSFESWVGSTRSRVNFILKNRELGAVTKTCIVTNTPLGFLVFNYDQLLYLFYTYMVYDFSTYYISSFNLSNITKFVFFAKFTCDLRIIYFHGRLLK